MFWQVLIKPERNGAVKNQRGCLAKMWNAKQKIGQQSRSFQLKRKRSFAGCNRAVAERTSIQRHMVIEKIPLDEVVIAIQKVQEVSLRHFDSDISTDSCSNLSIRSDNGVLFAKGLNYKGWR